MKPRSLCVMLAGSALALTGMMTDGGPTPAAAAPPEVDVIQPLTRDVVDYEDFTGRTEAAQAVTLRARVSGYLIKAAFQEGAKVKQGDLLFEIDPRGYQADVDRAKAELARAEAHLKRVAAELERAKALLPKGNISREEFDKITGDREEAQASVAVARASLEAARLQLDFSHVPAPINGKIGRRLLDPGNLVKADDTPLAVLVSTDPVYAFFDVDERSYLRLARALQQGKTKADPPVTMGLADEEGFPHNGKVDGVNNQADPTTGTIRFRAVFPNPQGLLIPGLFVRIRLATSSPYKALLVPDPAVGTRDGEKYLLVVNSKNVVERRAVKVGARQDDLRVVNEGLTANDQVIVRGLQRVRPGMTVKPKKVDASAR
jgi:RND family efflux transporter MFP subunit